jgi:hypothetical protein
VKTPIQNYLQIYFNGYYHIKHKKFFTSLIGKFLKSTRNGLETMVPSLERISDANHFLKLGHLQNDNSVDTVKTAEYSTNTDLLVFGLMVIIMKIN